MAVIKRPTDNNVNNKRSSMIQLFLMGIFFGAFIMYLYLDTDGHTTTTPSAYSGIRSITTTTTSSSVDGWHPINVYYGDRVGLNAPETQQSYAQVKQDLIVLDLIGEDGYFIDLAANDAKELTNTLVLERHGWNGLCIEPNPIYWYGLSHRKCIVVGALVGGTKQKVKVKFRGVYGGIIGNMDNKLANRKKEPDTTEEERYTAPIQQVLDIYNVPKTIDYLSLDVEGSEYEIMKDFPFQQYTIKIMTIERPTEQLKSLLISNGYIELKTLAWWGEYLWCHRSTGYTPDHPKIQKIITEERN